MIAAKKIVIVQISETEAVLCIKRQNGETEQVAIKNKVTKRTERSIGNLSNTVLQQLKEN